MHLIFYKLCEFSRGHITQLIFVTPSLGWNTKSHMKTWQLELIPPKFTRHVHIIWYKASDHLIILHRHSTFPWRVFGLTPPLPLPPKSTRNFSFCGGSPFKFFFIPLGIYVFTQSHKLVLKVHSNCSWSQHKHNKNPSGNHNKMS